MVASIGRGNPEMLEEGNEALSYTVQAGETPS